MKDINERKIKEILRLHDEKIANIHEKMLSLYRELENNGELLESAAFPSMGISGMPGAKGGHKDLGDVLLRYNHQIYSRNKEIRELMWELAEEEDSVSRVWACFHALGEPYYGILHKLYVENQLYQAVEADFQGSHKTFERYRQRGIESILQLYGSGESIADLMRRQSAGEAGNRKTNRKSVEEEGYEQLSLPTFLAEK